MEQQRRRPLLGDQQGFTLPEMAIAILVSLLVMAGVSCVFLAHARQYNQQDDTAELQQNLRGVMSVMAADLRLTGCDMANGGRGGIQEVEIKKEENGKEIITISGESTCKQVDGEARAYCYQYREKDLTLLRSSESSCDKDELQPLAENIAGMELNFCLEDEKTCSPETPSARKLNKVTAIQLAVLARASKPSQGSWVPPGYTPSTDPTDPNKPATGKIGRPSDPKKRFWIIEADKQFKSFARHKLLVTTVQMRNVAMRTIQKEEE